MSCFRIFETKLLGKNKRRLVQLKNTPTVSLHRGKTPTNKLPEYDTKQSDGEAPVMLELLGIWSTPSLL